MIISPFTPLFFDTYSNFRINSRYVQVFSPDDTIVIQVIVNNTDDKPPLVLKNEVTSYEISLVWNVRNINQETVLCFCNLKGLNEGFYKVLIGNKESDVFNVTSDSEKLNLTTLIKYTMSDNRSRNDAIWFVDDKTVYFSFRAPGGFKDDGWTFSVDNEQFTTANGNITELYANDIVNKTFTLGTVIGCPIYYAALLNRIMCCSYVYFDNVRYSRVDNNVPEQTKLLDTVDSFVFNIILRPYETTIIRESYLSLRSVESGMYRIIEFGNDSKILAI